MALRSFREACFAIVIFASPVHAQDETADAAALIDEGLALRRSGDDAVAAERFRAAIERGGGPRAIAQLGLAEQALGSWLEAEAHLVEALAADDPWIARRAATLRESLEAVRAHIGLVLIEGNVEGALIRVNGREIGALPLAEPVRVEEGTAIVDARAEGHFAIQRPVAIVAGQTARVQLALVARERESIEGPIEARPLESNEAARETLSREVPPPTPDTTSENFLIAGIATLGVSALSAIAMIIALAVREANVLVWNDDTICTPPDREPECESEGSTLRSAEHWAIGLGVASGIGAVTGISLVAFSFASNGSEARASLSVAGRF
jgi:hypothetical protein